MLGVALGVAALITILSIMNGFESELRDRILGMAAHIVIESDHGQLSQWRNVARNADQQPNVVASAPYIRREAMLTHYESVQGAVIRGVVPAAEIGVSVVSNKLVDGELALSDGRYNVVLGRGLANALRARVGSRVTLIAPEPMRTPAGMVPRLRRFNVVGIFEAGVHEYDTSLALVHLEDAKRMFRYGDGISGVRLKLADPFDAPQVGARLVQTLQMSGSEVLRVTDWTQTNVNLFRALKTEKMVIWHEMSRNI